jgi:hypothetical protein
MTPNEKLIAELCNATSSTAEATSLLGVRAGLLGIEKPSREPNYMPIIEGLIAEGTIPTVAGTISEAVVYHDDGCSLWSGGVCGCSPDIRIIRRDRTTGVARP